MSAGNLNVCVETGALWTRDIQCLAPDTPIEAQAVIAGQRIFVDGTPQLAYSVTPMSNNRTRIAFGRGMYSDISITVASTSMVSPAIPVPIKEAKAAYAVTNVDDATNASEPSTVEIPSTISGDELTLTLTLDATATAAMDGLEGSHSWDCYVRTDQWDWKRILEGTLVVIDGDAR